MTIQITVRLPDDQVEFIDAEVTAGRASSRAAVVSAAMRREQRRRAALRDLDILAADATVDADDLAALSSTAATTPLDID